MMLSEVPKNLYASTKSDRFMYAALRFDNLKKSIVISCIHI